MQAILALEDGRVFRGGGYGRQRRMLTGEVVLNTSITGYQEVSSLILPTLDKS